MREELQLKNELYRMQLVCPYKSVLSVNIGQSALCNEMLLSAHLTATDQLLSNWSDTGNPLALIGQDTSYNHSQLTIDSCREDCTDGYWRVKTAET